MPKSKSEEVKKWLGRIGWIASLLAKFAPAKFRVLMVAVSTIAGGLVALLDRCDHQVKPSASPVPSASPIPTPAITPSPIPSPKPTPRPPRILIDRAIVVGHPFTVRYTAPFAYNTHLWADKWRLGYMGKDVDGGHVLYAVVLNTPGKRTLTVRNDAGNVLASEGIEVHP